MEDEDGRNDENVRRKVNDRHNVDADVPAYEERGGKERDRLHVPGCDPEPGRKGTSSIRKDAYSLVYERMEKVEDRNEDERETNEKEIVVVDDPPGLPDKEEDRNRDGDSSKFDRGMVEREVVPAYEPEKNGDDCPKAYQNEIIYGFFLTGVGVSGWGVRLFSIWTEPVGVSEHNAETAGWIFFFKKDMHCDFVES